jgi:cytochrome c
MHALFRLSALCLLAVTPAFADEAPEVPGEAAAQALADETYDRIKLDAGAAVFQAECSSCHSPDAEGENYGPPLENVLGRAAGSWPNFPYSEALKMSGIIWTDAALRAWMEDNTGFMPGTKMRHVGIDDPMIQDILLHFLNSISQGE